MKQQVQEHVTQLRQWMAEQDIEALVVPTMDPHNSEYVPARWQCRQWLTGFTGSAGTAVLTPSDALLWTDSRYWLQAGEQLSGTPFRLMRDLVDPTVNSWLRQHVEGRVGYLPDMMVEGLFDELFQGLETVALQTDPFSLFWTDRPGFPLSLAERMPDDMAGETAQSKLARLQQWLREQGKESVLLNDLSEIMWMLNLRGDDIPYNPFIISFLLVPACGRCTFYVHREQIGDAISDYLDSLSVDMAPYEQAPRSLEGETPVSFWRARKTEAEQEGFRQAHLRDGVAMVQFLRRLDDWSANPEAELWSELRVDRELTALRAGQSGFRGLSFETIAGYAEHGAVVHYEPTPETDKPLERRGLLLLDSGGHYNCGSTDLTRTVPLGPLTPEERFVFTLVLKGHLQLQHSIFPAGTTGLQLDTMARMPLWRSGYDYGHGTGHGVGHRLGVHEGPVQFRKNCRRDTTLPLILGQTITDEPGVYVEGRFGVRHENTLLVVPAFTNEFGEFWQLEPLTRCPYDLRAVVAEMLTADERRWLNDYHAIVRRDLSPLLADEADRNWLRWATRSI